jgi:hypothetical protein
MIKFKGPQGPWEPYYTRKPLKVNGRWYWFTTVYRRELNQYVWPPQGYEYGDQFDALRDS